MYNNFSALDGCDMQIDSKLSLEVKSKMSFFSERQNYFEKNGRFSTAKLSLEVKSKMSFFSERQNYFEEKKHRLFVFLLRASYMQKGSEIEFSSLAEEI